MADSSTSDRDGRSSPAEMEAPFTPATPIRTGINPQAVENVIYSDIGINTLLIRLKQSIASAKEFAEFLKRRSSLEDDHAKGLKKLTKLSLEASRNQDARAGSYALQLADVSRAQDRMAANGDQFAISLQQMHDDLNELSTRMEKERKYWKTEGMKNEKSVKDAETAMDKAKVRYWTLAEDYDRVRTGDKGTGRVFTVKGPKTAERHEEDLLRKLEAADREYQTKVSVAQTQRQDNLSTLRPQAVKTLQELIRECDAALTLQMQKFAAFNEKLLVSNGLTLTPIKDSNDGGAGGPLSVREMVNQIDNERDFQTYVTSQTSSVPPKPAEIRYERHPSLGPPSYATQAPKAPMPSEKTAPTQPTTLQSPTQTQARPPQPQTAPTAREAQPPVRDAPRQQQPPLQASSIPDKPPVLPSPVPNSAPYGLQQNRPQRSDIAYRGPPSQSQQSRPQQSEVVNRGPPNLSQQSAAAAMQNGTYGSYGKSSYNSAAPPPPQQQQQQYLPQIPTQQQQQQQQQPQQYTRNMPNGSYASRDAERQPSAPRAQAPSRRVFGETLDNLFRRDELPVPLVVSQCIQAVDLFGLQVEGIYRLSGNASHINQLKQLFDTDASRVDFRNPEHFHHDVNSVAGLLKQFFRELPDTLLTAEFYNEFIEAGRIDDDIVRRDSLHAVINSLPDPNYATLRALVLHLNRVIDHSQANRMSSNNLAICFAPTIMGPHRGPDMRDAGLQARVIDTMLQNTFQIFDED